MAISTGLKILYAFLQPQCTSNTTIKKKKRSVFWWRAECWMSFISSDTLLPWDELLSHCNYFLKDVKH
jgi:hypothetical protein